MAKIKAVLAGSTGFLGSAIKEQLCDRYDFTFLTRNDIATAASLPKADVLFHAAGVIKGRKGLLDNSSVYRENFEITLNLLEMARHAKIHKIVFAGSYIYGKPLLLPVDETHPIQAISPYMHSKIISEDLIKTYSQWYGMAAVSLRLFNPYGAGQKKGTLVADILNQLDEKEIQLGDPNPKRDFIYIDDVVNAFHLAAAANIQGFEAVNIGSGESHSARELAETLLKNTPSAAQLVFFGENRPNEIADIVANIQKAKNLLGWVPSISFNEGLRNLALKFSGEKQPAAV